MTTIRTQRSALAIAVALSLQSYAFAQSPQQPPVEEEEKQLDGITVRGVRDAIFSARQIERDTNVITNVVTSDDVGQFADQSVAESLQRVPGIGVDRDSGEARRLTVRGLGPLFNPVRLNGMLIGSSDLDRDAVVDVLPNDLLGTLEVTKTLTPDMDGDAVGGAVDLLGIDAFERDRGGSVRVEANQQRYSGETRPKGSVNYNTAIETAGGGRFGVSLAASYSDRILEGDVLRNRDTPVYSRVGADCSPVTPDCFLRTARAEQRFDVSERERTGVAASLQYAPTGNAEFYFRAVGSQFDREDVQYTNRYQIASNSATAIGPRTGTFRNSELRKQVNFLTRDEQTWMAQVGGTSQFDAWTLEFMTGVSENELDIPEQLTGRFRVRGITVDIAQDDDSIIATPRAGTAATSNPDNPANYAFDNLTLVQEFRTDDILNARMDATREMEWGNLPGFIKFGVKFNRRDKDVDRQETSGNPSGTGGVPATTLASLGLITVPTRLPGYGFMPDPNQALSLFRSARGALQPQVVNSAAQDFFVEENVDAAYLMGSVDVTDDISLFGGLRFEETTWTTSGNEVDNLDRLVGADVLTVRALAGARNNYADILPSLHLRWNLNPDMVLRAALTSAVIRPNFDEGAATRSVSTREITGAAGTYFRSLSGGNPQLNALTADQLDLSLGWYPTDTTFLYGGLFYKRIDDFYVNGQFVGSDVALIGLPVGNGTLTGGFDVANVILNGDRATVRGIEFAFEQAFVDLPGWLSGLFISGNATFLDSKARIGILRPGETLPLPDQADRIGNLSLGWENERFTVRASANFRDEQLDTVSSNPDLDQVLQPYFSWDLNLRWNINDAFQLYFDAVNLNERKDVTVFRGDASGPFPADEQVNDFGRSYGLGVRYTF